MRTLLLLASLAGNVTLAYFTVKESKALVTTEAATLAAQSKLHHSEAELTDLRACILACSKKDD